MNLLFIQRYYSKYCIEVQEIIFLLFFFFNSYNAIGDGMKEPLLLALKGTLIGLGKVIPGVSGSLIAVSLGIYERAINAISHFFQNIKENIAFLGTLSIGILLSIVFGSKIIIYLLEFCYVPTMLLFIGFIVGAIPRFFVKYKCDKNFLLVFFLSFFFLIGVQLFTSHSTFVPQDTIGSYAIILGIGFLDAATMIIPGVSGTAIFMILGCYEFVLNLFASLSDFNIRISDIINFIFFGIGLVIGIYLVSKLMGFLLRKYPRLIYACITGFAISSIFLLLQKVSEYPFSFYEWLIGIVLAIFGYSISAKFRSD